MKLNKTLTNLAHSIEKGAEATWKKSGELVTLTKLKVDIASLESQISEVYEEIGERIYKRYENGKLKDDSLDRCFKKIKKLKKEIEELKGQATTIKNKKLCKLCGTEILDDSKYCPECGIKQ